MTSGVKVKMRRFTLQRIGAVHDEQTTRSVVSARWSYVNPQKKGPADTAALEG